MKMNGHYNVEAFADADWAEDNMDKKSTSFCVTVGENLVSWHSKKQKVVSPINAEAAYRAMATMTAEIMWTNVVLMDMGVEVQQPVQLYCDNQAAIRITANPVFHERTKHIEVDCHYVHENVQSGEITTVYTKSEDQAANIFTKAVAGSRLRHILNKQGAMDIYRPQLEGEC